MAEFSCDITKELGVLSESNKGWRKELNIISWNGANPKYDIQIYALLFTNTLIAIFNGVNSPRRVYG